MKSPSQSFHRLAFILFYALCCLILGFWISNGSRARGAIDSPLMGLGVLGTGYSSSISGDQTTLITTLGIPQEAIDRAAFRLYIQHWEGYSLKGVTHPARGKWVRAETTVGIGHNTKYGMDIVGGYQPGRLYTARDITVLFDQDYARAIGACRVQIARFDALPRAAKWVCLSLCWCCGPTGLSKWSNFEMCVEHRMYSLAATQLNDSRWAHQVPFERLNEHWNALNTIANR